MNGNQRANDEHVFFVVRSHLNLDFLLPQNQTYYDGGEHAAKGDRRDNIDTIVESKARRHMVGAHHEGDEQQGGEGGAGQRF